MILAEASGLQITAKVISDMLRIKRFSVGPTYILVGRQGRLRWTL